MARPKYIVEHMEEGLEEWPLLEYKNMILTVGADRLYLTALTPTTLETLPESLRSAHCCSETVLGLPGMDMTKVCLLDPAAKEELTPKDGELFEWFLFGGILGDDPPRDRTSELRRLGFQTRHLGPIQMTTDTALVVTKRVVEDRIILSDIPYIDNPEIRFSRHECVEMPFRYIAQICVGKDGKEVKKPLMPNGMFELLKKDNGASFDPL